jgi:uncharacterized damage-inducible protein DinB
MDMKPIVRSQFEASFAMLVDCIEKCPDAHWESAIAKYPFWHAAYHTLCFVDVYLTVSDEAWMPHAEFHPKGRQELEDEYPSRRFTREELLAYAAFCREKIGAVLGDGAGAETDESLADPSGFPWLPFTRAELHLYNMRHIQHHAGQLGAVLRRAGVDLKWVKRGLGA